MENTPKQQYQATDPWRKVVLESALDAVVAMDANNQIIDWNVQAEKIFGWRKEEVIGKMLANIVIPPSFRPAHQKGLEHFLQTGEGPILNKRIEVSAVNRQGNVFPVELTVIPINIEGSYIFYSFLRDISVQRKLELERKEVQRQIELLSEVTKVLIADPLGISNRVEKFVHMLVPEVADWAMIDIQDDDQVRLMAASHRRPELLSQMQEIKASIDRASTLSTCQEELVPAITDEQSILQPWRQLNIKSYLCLPLRAHGEILGKLTLMNDQGPNFDESHLPLARELGQRVAFAIHNAQLYHKAQTAVAARDEFLSIASHELKTPITSLKLNTQMFEWKSQHLLNNSEDHGIGHLLGVYNRNVERMSKLIDDMLDITRISTGRFQLELKPEDLGQLLRAAVDRLSTELSQSGMKINLELEDKLPITCDKFRMEQVFSNLITNAIKYAPASTLNITSSSDGSRLTIQFADNGPGIEKANLDRIFTRFERAVSANVSGLGLGLYISRQIIEAHDGKIWAQSTLGKGTTFHIELPVASEERKS